MEPWLAVVAEVAREHVVVRDMDGLDFVSSCQRAKHNHNSATTHNYYHCYYKQLFVL